MFLSILEGLSNKIKTSFSIKLPTGQEIEIGRHHGTPQWQVVINSQKGLRALKSADELKIAEAYIYGEIDINGPVDMLKLLEIQNFVSNHPFIKLMNKVIALFSGQIAVNKSSIAQHYEFDDDFYLLFLDKTRSYSQAVFAADDESLEQASLRKLEFAMNSCQLTPGKKVLDLGGGWGNTVEYLGSRGIEVDAVTISDRSASFIQRLISEKKLPCNVKEQDFLTYVPPHQKTYDAIFSLGTLEHLPNYHAVLKRCNLLLNKGGYAYFDASAKSLNTPNSNFISRHIFPGNHELLNIYSFLKAVKKTGFELISLHNDRHNYYLTIKHWAQNLDNHRDEIIKRWGKTLYRKFQIYLWGSCYGMLSRQVQAYRIVLRKN